MEDERVDTLPKPVAVALTIAAAAAVVGIAYRVDRAYSRWSRDWLRSMSPLTKPRARYVRARDGYRVRRDDTIDLFKLMNELWDEIDVARALPELT